MSAFRRTGGKDVSTYMWVVTRKLELFMGVWFNGEEQCELFFMLGHIISASGKEQSGLGQTILYG